jgi:hypothetical protein
MHLPNTQTGDSGVIARHHWRIGVVGYCPPTKFDESEARRMINEAYDEVVVYSGPAPIAIVSGLTNVGVLAIAYEEAVKRGWRTVGVACKRAMEHPLFPVDELLVVGENWGDESSAFVSILDAMIRIGTGKQSVRETDAVRAQGMPTFEYDLPVLD